MPTDVNNIYTPAMNVNSPIRGGFVLPGRKRKEPVSDSVSDRLPFLKMLPKGFRPHFVAMSGEFTGTFLFLFFAYSGTQVANTRTAIPDSTQLAPTSDPAQLLYIALCFGFSLAVNAWVFFRISGGLFNPAVTLGMCLVGALPYVRGGLLFIAQMLGGMAAAAVVAVLFPGPLNVRTSLAGGTSVTQGVFIEMFLTAQLVFTIFMLAAEKHKATFIAPIGIGLSLFIAELTGVFYTGGSLNPTRSFGPCVVLRSFQHYHWIYWVGPLLGSLLASGFYKFIKSLEYESANPGQDFDEKEDAAFDPEVDISRPTPGLPAGGQSGNGAADHVDHHNEQDRWGSGPAPPASTGHHADMSHEFGGMRGSHKEPGFSPGQNAVEQGGPDMGAHRPGLGQRGYTPEPGVQSVEQHRRSRGYEEAGSMERGSAVPPVPHRQR